MALLTVGDVDLHYVEYPGDSRGSGTVLLLHGFTCDHRMMTAAFEPVFESRRDWSRIYLDLPGHGRSGSAGIDSTDAVFGVMADAIAALVPEGPLLVAGESYGGYLAQGLVEDQPATGVAGVCLVAPAVIAAHGRRVLPAREIVFQDPEIAAAIQSGELDPDSNFAQLAVAADARTLRRTTEEIDPGTALADADALARIESGYTGSWEARPRPRFEGPSLMIAGRQDHITGYADQWALVDTYPRMTYAVLDRAGHNVHIEQDVLFAALVHEWLDRVEESLRA
ncbi:alpha/beta fold hydrolase [Nocardioides speluncae]|uniref:alpha/beta fold hydrolase n=1 Tax=Nocardioides speluncae TaxID=2670337 RepID=UPI000D691BB2|nr:alpha/beta hydrolase [Nocardioides speluncae]